MRVFTVYALPQFKGMIRTIPWVANFKFELWAAFGYVGSVWSPKFLACNTEVF